MQHSTYVSSYSASSAELSPRNTAASRLFSSVKRTLSYSSPKRRHVNSSFQSDPMGSRYSVDELPPRSFTPSQFRYQDPSSTRPSIEQIAMGLHVSRTPHLRSGKPHPLGPVSIPSPHHNPHYASSSTLVHHQDHHHIPIRPPTPITPLRSSLKKTHSRTGSNSNSNSTTTTTLHLQSSPSMSSSTNVESPTPSLLAPSSGKKHLDLVSSGPAMPVAVSLKTRMSRLLPIRRVTYSGAHQQQDSSPSPPETPGRRKAVRFSSSTMGLNERAQAQPPKRPF